jgi:hypothetical protein
MNEIPNIREMQPLEQIFRHKCSSAEEFLNAFKQLSPVPEDCERVMLPDDSPREACFGIAVIDFFKEKPSKIKRAIIYLLHIKYAREIPLIFEMHSKMNEIFEEYLPKILNSLKGSPNEL